MQQLSFDLQIQDQHNLYAKEDFLALDENFAALNFLKKFFTQKNFALSQFPSLILRGAAKSGKTHLLNIFATEFKAEFLQEEAMSKQNLSSFFIPNKFYILENIEKIKDEELLLHIINSAAEAKAFLILSSINKVEFQLKDLASRIKNIFPIEIKSPSHETIRVLLINELSRKQLKVSGGLVDFITDHIERSYEAIDAAVRLVEFHHQETGKNINMKEVVKIFG